MEINDYFIDIYSRVERQSPGSNFYTKRAFEALPLQGTDLDILDVGCGTGSQTMELASVPGVDIYAIDNNNEFLIKLKEKVNNSEFSRKVKVINTDMKSLPFRDAQFDIIWSEGAIYIIGFEKGLKEWKNFLKIGGFLVVSEISWIKSNPPQEILDYWNNEYSEMSDIQEKIKIIENSGYELLDHFIINESAWTNNYYMPLANACSNFLKNHNNDPIALKVVDEIQKEFEMYKKYKDYYSYVYYLMRLK